MSTKDIDLIPVGYFILDYQGCIVDCNDIGARLAGVDRPTVRGQRFGNLVAPKETWRFQKHLRLAAQSGRRESCRIELKGNDADNRPTHLYTRAEFSDQNALVRFHTAILTVATELITAKEEAERMSRLKTAFLGNMSHEIRTPLTGIIGFAAVLSKELPSEQREFAELIRASGRRLLEMLNSVLDLAKLESDEMDLELGPIRLDPEIRDVAEMLRPIAVEKGLRIEISVQDGPLALVLADRAALNRIVHNLIGNAIKFTDKGHVRIVVWSTEEQAGFDVVDTGVGIEPAFIPQLFDDFSQESIGSSRSHAGTGLGLAVTRRLVDLLGGDIHVESTKNAGSRFRVAFPRSAEPSATPTPPLDGSDAAEELGDTNGDSTIRLLLVEDHPETRHLLKELLQARYHVSVAGSAKEAYRTACMSQFDLILMDIKLGQGPDGIELLKKLRRTSGYENTPIVAVTAHALPGDKGRFLEIGFTDYVSKPFDPDELLGLPVKILQHHKD
ncbi:MAG: ATP-binding protein [Rhodothermales bacterium]